MGRRRRRRTYPPVTPEMIAELEAEYLAELELEEAEWWPCGVPVPITVGDDEPVHAGKWEDYEGGSWSDDDDDLPF